jgi:outer membrane protein assembly factor BamB
VTANTFHKLSELRVDDKIEASPLFVPNVSTRSGPHDLLIVATTRNTVYAFDTRTNTQVWSKSLGPPVEGIKPAPYDEWGVTSTPVVDPDSNTLYIVRLVWEGGNKLYRLVGLRLSDGSE